MTARLALFSAALGLSLPKWAHADNAISYKYEDYREADGRVAVQTQSALITQDLGTDTEIKVSGTTDAIAGATPSGVPALNGATQVPEIQMHDHRKAWSLDLDQQLPVVNVDLGFAYSREHDYTSYGWSLNTVADFNQKNTELILGVAGTEDNVEVFIPGPPWQHHQSGSGIIGLTQLLNPETSLTFDVTWSRETGFNSDQYKLVEKSVQIFPGIFLPTSFAENRPNSKDKATVLVGINRAFTRLRGAIEASYRYYADSYGVEAHTLEVAWIQRVGSAVILQPSFRLYRQTAANFYYYDLDDYNVVPVRIPNGTGPFYSSDYRLSDFRSFNGGIKVVWNIRSWCEVDAAFNRYDMQGLDGITPQSAYTRAKITTGGVKFLW